MYLFMGNDYSSINLTQLKNNGIILKNPFEVSDAALSVHGNSDTFTITYTIPSAEIRDRICGMDWEQVSIRCAAGSGNTLVFSPK